MALGKVMHSSEEMNWRTPETIISLVSQVAPIDLDPCASRHEHFQFAGYNLTQEMEPDGLCSAWSPYVGDGLVFVNPPYGRAMKKSWAPKISKEADAGVDMVVLCAARTGVPWFRSLWDHSDAACFWRGRLTFMQPDTDEPAADCAGFDSAVLYWGPTPGRFASAFWDYGKVVMG